MVDVNSYNNQLNVYLWQIGQAKDDQIQDP
jgi:hypothetical protein